MKIRVRGALGALCLGLLAGCDDNSLFAAEPPAAPPATAAASIAPAPTQPAPVRVLSANGWDGVTVGLAEAEAAKRLGGAIPDSADPDCHHLLPNNDRGGMAVMIRDGEVARVTLHGDSRTLTDRGLGLGATESQVRAAYGDSLQVQPHHYLGAPAKYLTWWAKPGERGVRYETDALGVVTDIHGGDTSIQLVEGCS